MLEKVLNTVLLRELQAKKAREQFRKCIKSEFAEEFLELLLKLMSLVLFLDEDFKRNIKGFKGRYLFRSRDNSITVAAVFKKNRMRVYEQEIDRTNVTVTFRNEKALMNYLLSPKPDILGSILRQDVTIDGNFNYLYKFAYMSKHLQLMVTGKT
jgi:ubiquinone biosynthesis protein UbiJ